MVSIIGINIVKTSISITPVKRHSCLWEAKVNPFYFAINKYFKVFQCFLFVVTVLIRDEFRKLQVIISVWCKTGVATLELSGTSSFTLCLSHMELKLLQLLKESVKKKKKINISHSSHSVKTQQLWTFSLKSTAPRRDRGTGS